MRKKIITRSILLVSFVSMFTDIASEMLYPVMPVFLRSIGFSVLLIGILEGLAEAVAGFSKGYFGKLSDISNKRLPFIQWGYALSAISKPMMAAFTYPIWIFFARTLDRFGKGIRTGARDALLSDESTPENKGKVFGFHRSMDTIGAAIGPALALVFLFFFPADYSLLFIIAFFPGLVAILLTLFIRKDTVKPKKILSEKKHFFSFLSYWKKSDKLFKMIVIGLLAFTLFNSSDAFLLLMLKYKGISDVQMIGLYIFYNLVYALVSFPIGYIADRIGLKRVLIAGLFIFSAVYISFGFINDIVFILIIFLLYGIYAASTEGISKAWITNSCSKDDTATAIGFYTGFASIITMLSSSLTGFLWYVFNPGIALFFSGAGVFFVAIYFSFFKLKIIKNNNK